MLLHARACRTVVGLVFATCPINPTLAQITAPTVVHLWPSISAYESSNRSALKAFELPILVDMEGAIRQCVWALTNSFDHDREDEPFFYANRRSDGLGEFHHAVEIGVPHVVGRALWGATLAEEAAGVPFPGDALDIYVRYLKSSFDNEDHLNSYVIDGTRKVEFHNMREGLLGLIALMRRGDDKWAKDKAQKMIRTLESLTDTDGHWTMTRASEIGLGGRCTGLGVDATTSGRVIEPLVLYYRHTHDPLALRLAELYARSTLDSTFAPNGDFLPMEHSSGHIHSITSSLSGITEFALQVNDQEMLKRCRRIMRNGVPKYHSSWGWGDEVMPEHPANVVSRGEINQTGDVIRTALLLGQAGDAEYYELAERYLRSMLLPTQHFEEEMARYVMDNPNPTSDAFGDVRRRVSGGYSMQLPNDRMREGDWPLSTLDITSGAVHALCECYRHRVTTDASMVGINLLFDYNGEDITVTSKMPQSGVIQFVSRTTKEVRVRVPTWVNRGTIHLVVDDIPQDIDIQNNYLSVRGLKPDARGQIKFDVPVAIKKETIDGTEFTVTWLGDQVIDIQPRGKVSPLPF